MDKDKKNSKRSRLLEDIRKTAEKDKASPERLSKWLKIMECKKKVFALEDEIDKLTKGLRKGR